ncbi:Golgi-associated olfactory signaling regulator [Carlito syrichta]|uniref:Golgi-associated olfactory signaling regulator n=1 Tax=Carlito syrichta TaxID=1868482 RepID=A0A1U7SHN1_CARSF|nr:Golgi-associated olfactory signaling regulator [Carlito syrichta]
MKSFNLILFLLAGLGSKAAPSAPLPLASDFPGMGHPSEILHPAFENSTGDQPNPEFPGNVYPEPSKKPHAISLEASLLDFTETPNPDLQDTPHPESPGTPKADPLTTSISESLDTPKTNASKKTHPEPSEAPNPNPSKTSHPEFPETPNTNPMQTTHQESPESPKLNATEISHAAISKTPNPDPTKTLDPKSPETHDPDITETPNSEFPQTLHPDPTETSHPESHVTHDPIRTEISQTEFPTTHYQSATDVSMTSDPETSASLYPETPAPFKDEATALNELPPNPKPETLATTQAASPELLVSDSPGTTELRAPQNSSPKDPDTPASSVRIAGPPALPGPPNQLASATLRASQQRSGGESVNTIIVVERVKETAVRVSDTEIRSL